MNHVGLKLTGQVFDDQRIMRAFVDADAASNAQAFGNVGLSSVLIHNDAFLPVSYRWTEHLTLVVALLGLTVVLLQNRNTHFVTQPILSSVLFCFTCRSPGKTRRNGVLCLCSNEALEVLVPADEAGGARGRELHAGLAQCIAGREIVFGVDLN